MLYRPFYLHKHLFINNKHIQKFYLYFGQIESSLSNSNSVFSISSKSQTSLNMFSRNFSIIFSNFFVSHSKGQPA